MKNNLFLAGVCVVAVSASAQTVTVDGTTAPPTNYPTLAAALLSFDAGTTGPNSGNVAPNVINITTFGPHDLRVPVLGSGAVALTGTAVAVVDGTEGFTIVGSGVKPLLLVQNNEVSSGDGIVIQNAAANVFTNLVLATSPTGTAVGDDLIFVLGDGTSLTMNDCVVTALPTASTTYTSIGDIPAGFLDGSAAYDSANVQTLDNGMFVGSTGNTNVVVNMNNTVLCQQGTTATPDGIVVSAGGTLNLNAGSVVSANARLGIQLSSSTANIVVSGTTASPVIFSNHNDATNGDAIRPFGAAGATLDIDNAVFVNNTAGLNIFTGASLTLTTLEITNSVFANNTTGLILGDDGTGVSTALVSDCTFFGNTTGARVAAAWGTRSLSFTDCVFAGTGTGLDVDNAVPATLATSALVGSGANALTAATANSALLTQSPAAVTADPAFTSTSYTAHTTSRLSPDFWLRVTSGSYATAGSSGSNLTGGGIGSFPSAVADWRVID